MNQPLNRREAIKLGAAFAACAAIPSGSLAQQSESPKRRPIKKAVMWGMIKGGKTVRDRFEILKEAGFDGVEMDSPGGPPNDEIRKASEETGILVEGVVDSVHWKQCLSDPSPKVRDIALKALEQALRDCKAIGGTSVLLVPGVVNAEVSYDQCYERSQEQIRKAIPLAEQLGVRIAIEDVWNNFLLSPMEAARYVDEFNSPAVGWHMDLGNIVAYGYPEQWVKILNKRIVKLHVKEFSRRKMNEEGRGKGFNVKIGEGDINWKAVMQALDEVGYNTWMCAEVSGGGVNELKDIGRRMDRILAM
jgi:L-ribulose-5-phosphate 3-epimerase